jgi:hypothetical protein
LVTVNDRASDRAIDFERVIDIPSGRVQPGDEYEAWQKFAREADALVARDVVVATTGK